MPAIEIQFQDVVFDPKVQTYCINPNFKCPNYGHSWACPPEAPYLKDEVSSYQKYFLIYYEFSLKDYINKIKEKNSKRSEESIRNSFYRKDIIRDYLENEIFEFLKNYNKKYNQKLILWDGYCRICYKEGKTCTFDSNKLCRYLTKIRYSMEAVGIDVDKTVRALNFFLEWPPINYAYRFGLICLK